MSFLFLVLRIRTTQDVLGLTVSLSNLAKTKGKQYSILGRNGPVWPVSRAVEMAPHPTQPMAWETNPFPSLGQVSKAAAETVNSALRFGPAHKKPQTIPHLRMETDRIHMESDSDSTFYYILNRIQIRIQIWILSDTNTKRMPRIRILFRILTYIWANV